MLRPRQTAPLKQMPSSWAPARSACSKSSSWACSTSKAHVIDALPHPGGQPAELYPDKPIYDIPGVPFCTGQSLTDSLLQQIAPFNARFHLGQQVTTVQRQDDGRFQVATTRGAHFLTKTLFIAAGVGAFPAANAEGEWA